MKVRNIRLREVHCAAPEATLMDIATIIRNFGVGAVPVCEGKHLRGMVTDRNIAVACIANDLSGSTCLAKDYMITHPRPISPDVEVEEAARIMATDKVNYLPVIENGNLVGLVSLGDLALALRGNDKLVAETLRTLTESS
jgi:CBS domain-containing protein